MAALGSKKGRPAEGLARRPNMTPSLWQERQARGRLWKRERRMRPWSEGNSLVVRVAVARRAPFPSPPLPPSSTMPCSGGGEAGRRANKSGATRKEPRRVRSGAAL